MEILHSANIAVHVLTGTLALLVGLVPIFSAKGGTLHRRIGRYYLGLTTVVVLTAALGVAVFEFRPFLTIVVGVAGYQAFSGYRVLRLKTTGPQRLDTAVALLALVGTGAFGVLLHRIDLVWARGVMYAVLGTLAATAAYDLARPLFRLRWVRGRFWLYEHLWKMLGTYSALLSAFSGTVLEAYQPYSQFLPSVLVTSVALGFLGYYLRRPPTSARVSGEKRPVESA